MMHWGPQNTLVLSSALLWMRLLIVALIAFAMMAMAARISQRQDF
jgi:hypothetical protein